MVTILPEASGMLGPAVGSNSFRGHWPNEPGTEAENSGTLMLMVVFVNPSNKLILIHLMHL